MLLRWFHTGATDVIWHMIGERVAGDTARDEVHGDRKFVDSESPVSV